MEELKLTIPEARNLLLLSQSSVYSWIDKGKLHSVETPGGKVIIISRKEAEEIRNFNLKSRRNKVAKQVLQNTSQEDASGESPIINAEVMENEGGSEQPSQTQKAPQDVTLTLISRIEELAIEAGRFKQLEILRNEEIANVKFWQEKYHELSAELKEKNFEINALKMQVQELQKELSHKSLFNFLKKK